MKTEAADIGKALDDMVAGMTQLETAMRENSVQRALPPIVELAPVVMLEQPAPVVEITVPAPNVNVTVPVPVVNVQQAQAPKVDIYAPASVPVGYVVRVTKRDAQGFIEEFTVTPAA